MTGDWFVHAYPQTGSAKSAIHFEDFTHIVAFVKMFEKSGMTDKLEVHASAKATDQELQELRELGYDPV